MRKDIDISSEPLVVNLEGHPAITTACDSGDMADRARAAKNAIQARCPVRPDCDAIVFPRAVSGKGSLICLLAAFEPECLLNAEYKANDA